MNTRISALLLVATTGLACNSAGAVLIDGIDFPDAWFADSITNFSQAPGPAAAFSDANQALGPRDVTSATGVSCFLSPSPANCKFVSLGDGGSLTIQFTDNFLNGSGTNANDLYVIEVGVAEGATVDVSPDGTNWTTVGTIPGGAGSEVGIFEYGFDVDAAGFGIGDMLTYVRLTDLNLMETSSPAGSDIDAVAAIQSVPLPAVAWLFPAGLIAGISWMRRRSA